MHNLAEPMRSALRSLAQALNQAEVQWRLGGSAMLTAIGLGVDVGDLDVTVPAHALEDVQNACGPWVRQLMIGHAPPPWCSDWLAKMQVSGVDVDVIGGMCVVGAGGNVRVPDDLGQVVDVDGVSVPLADPAVWWWIYRAYKPAKAEMLATVVTADQRREIERRLGPPPER